MNHFGFTFIKGSSPVDHLPAFLYTKRAVYASLGSAARRGLRGTALPAPSGREAGREGIVVTVPSLVTMGFLLLLLIFSPAWSLSASESKSVIYRNTAPGVAYLGSSVCAGCHKDIYDQYLRTDMGRSMSRVADSSQLEKVSAPITIFSKSLNRYFQIFREGSNLYQSQYELDSSGQEVFRNTQKLEFAIGSGANGHSYIVRRGEYLFQAPLSFYSKPKQWDFSPGYESSDQGFSRPILPACIVCHSGQPQPVLMRSNLYREPPFRELSIGCENCHGPGQLHVKERTQAMPVAGEIDNSIVNPAHLPGWLADNICMNCHQGGDTRILQPGKDYSDFRPGTPLDNTVGIFRIPFLRSSPPDSDLLEHYSSMTLSQCYRASAGQMSCQTCHNPHYQPSSQGAPGYYRNKCLTCHTEKSCGLPLPKRLSLTPPNDCSGCHLPKRDVKRIAHSLLTNHRIITRAGEPYPEAAFHQTTSALPDLIHVNAIPGKAAADISPLTLLQVYGTLMDVQPVFRERYLSVLDRVSKTQSDNLLVLSALARKASLEGTPQGQAQAQQYLRRAIELGSTAISDYQDLAELLARDSRLSEAVEILKQGISFNPHSSPLYKSLALRYITMKKYPDALETMKRELELFPEDSFMRKLVKQAEGTGPTR
ncbi:MAG: hypothetical protein DMG05_07170 [Acidobacteria bacterium]|nr:MAG: hypothetical protein DMG05_07170 [Acidobacteriota bacterium]